jgi:hypothetical protein
MPPFFHITRSGPEKNNAGSAKDGSTDLTQKGAKPVQETKHRWVRESFLSVRLWFFQCLLPLQRYFDLPYTLDKL